MSHRHKYQPRTQHSNLLGVPGLPVYSNTPRDIMRMNTDSYYRLLNCGLRLSAGAESWNNHVGAKHHFGGAQFGDIRYTEPFLNNQHHTEPTLYYLEIFASERA